VGERADARVVDEDLQAAEALDRRGDDAVARRAAPQVAGECDAACAHGLDLAHERIELGGVSRHDREARALARQRERARAADAAAGARDERGSVSDLHAPSIELYCFEPRWSTRTTTRFSACRRARPIRRSRPPIGGSRASTTPT